MKKSPEAPLIIPANIEAEVVLLGSILLDNSVYRETRILQSEDFWLSTHRCIFSRMCEMLDRQEPVDLITLTEELDQHKELESIGGRSYLCSLTEGVPRFLAVASYVRIIKGKSLARKLIAACQSAIDKAYDGQRGLQIIAVLRESLDDIESEARNPSERAPEPSLIEE